ncbi:MAG: bifunctional oligoribonuclease/PAP phosphatase NrnA [Candidatus Bathyarchaeia archaeon]
MMDEIRAIRPSLIVILCHHNADPDAVCSAFAISQLLKRVFPRLDVEIAAALGLSQISQHIVKAIPIRMVSSPRIEEADLLFLVDTNTVQQLEDWGPRVESSGKPLIVIDHHTLHPKTLSLAFLTIADENSPSTCEVVYRLFKEARVPVTKDEALPLFLGMAYDTKHFTLANSKTFKVAAELVDVGVNAKKALTLLSIPMELSERIARLKAAKRLCLVNIGEWLLAVSHVSSHQASAARALIALGAHVAVVVGKREQSLRISLRSVEDFHKKTDIHLGRDIAMPLGEYIHGMGGGHSTAAGANGIGDLEDAIEECIRLFRSGL